jgi:hypothetical protein
MKSGLLVKPIIPTEGFTILNLLRCQLESQDPCRTHLSPIAINHKLTLVRARKKSAALASAFREALEVVLLSSRRCGVSEVEQTGALGVSQERRCSFLGCVFPNIEHCLGRPVRCAPVFPEDRDRMHGTLLAVFSKGLIGRSGDHREKQSARLRRASTPSNVVMLDAFVEVIRAPRLRPYGHRRIESSQ